MGYKYIPAAILVVLTILLLGKLATNAPEENNKKDALTFSNTSAWNPTYLEVTERPTRYPADIFRAISLPPPPRNSSSETTLELASLHTLERDRSTQMVLDIVSEVRTRKVYLGGHSLEEYLDPALFPATAGLLADSIHDLQIIEMQQKRSFDRIRPSALDPSLSPAIVVPEHPAYPSYHSAEMHFYAYVFSELAPERREEFIARATQVSKNREIAGVHYPSDTTAGMLLAQQFFNIMMTQERFQTLLAAARAEWQIKGLSQE